MRLAALLIVISCCWFACVPTAFAAESGPPQEGSLLTSPSRLLASVAPGGTTMVTVIVRNNGSTPAAVQIGTGDLAAGTDEYSQLADAGTEERGAGEWLRPERTTAYLLDGQQQEVDVAVRVPPDAEPGGHYGAIVVERAQDGAGDVEIKVRLVTHVTVVVPGAIEYDAEVRRLRVPTYARDSVDIRFDVHNTGGIHVLPVARVELRGPRGSRRRETVKLRELLPGGSRTAEVRMKLPALGGRFRVAVDVQLEDRSRSKPVRARFWGARTGSLWAAAGVVGLILLLAMGWWVRRWLELRRYIREELEQSSWDERVSSEY